MRRVLFVDDESNVLQGLQRMLHPMRNQWDMVFASSGQEALDLLTQAPFDVIVTDMRMPGMDGAELLDKVMALYPHMVRIVLSGHSDPVMIFRSVKAAHQYLAKPCDAELLVHTVARALALRELLSDQSVQGLISKIGSLPSLPSLYEQMLAELHSPDPSPQRVGEIMARDVAMTAKILQLVNSAFFGLFRQVTHPAEAVRYLGIETVKALVISLHLFSELRPRPLHGFSAEQLWNHSLHVAWAAKRIAWSESHDPSLSNAAFTAGLLHDTGRLVLATALPDRYGPILRELPEHHGPLWELEKERLGTSHAEVGGYLIGIWGLPQEIVEATALHHRPSSGAFSGSRLPPVTAVHVADVILSDVQELGERAEGAGVDEEHLRALGRVERLKDWAAMCEEVLGEEGLHG